MYMFTVLLIVVRDFARGSFWIHTRNNQIEFMVILSRRSLGFYETKKIIDLTFVKKRLCFHQRQIMNTALTSQKRKQESAQFNTRMNNNK